MQRLFAHQQPRTKANTAGKLVRLGYQNGPNFDDCRTERDTGIRPKIEPREQGRVDSGTERSVPICQCLRERLLRVERGGAVERVIPIDSLDLNQCCAPVLRARHGPHGGGERYLPAAREKCALLGVR